MYDFSFWRMKESRICTEKWCKKWEMENEGKGALVSEMPTLSISALGQSLYVWKVWVLVFFSLPKNNDNIAKNHWCCCCWMAKDLPLAFPAEMSLMFLCRETPPVVAPLPLVCVYVFESHLYYWVDVMRTSPWPAFGWIWWRVVAQGARMHSLITQQWCLCKEFIKNTLPPSLQVFQLQ